MKKMTDRLEGRVTSARWVAEIIFVRSADTVRDVLSGIWEGLRSVIRRMKKLSRSHSSQTEWLLRRRGMTSELRWIFAVLLVWPMMLFRLAVIGLVAALWLMHAPQVAVQTWETIAKVESSPNKKRTPSENRPQKRLGDFNDVRARVSELTQ